MRLFNKEKIKTIMDNKMTKKNQDTMSNIAVGGIVSTVVVDNMPNPTGNTGITNLQNNFATGMGNVSTALPTMGRVKGTGMVLGSISKLKKAGKKLFKGGKTL